MNPRLLDRFSNLTCALWARDGGLSRAVVGFSLTSENWSDNATIWATHASGHTTCQAT
jgi:hypothetical protein